MAIGIITGSGTHALPGFEASTAVAQETPFGPVAVARGGRSASSHSTSPATAPVTLGCPTTSPTGQRLGAAGARRRRGRRLHRLRRRRPRDPVGLADRLRRSALPANRLPDGSLCTVFTEPGDPGRGTGSCTAARSRLACAALLDAAGVGHARAGRRHLRPRRRTALQHAERDCRACRLGVVAVSQTGGPETVLCGELELPYALIGFVTDYANEVRPGIRRRSRN